MNNWNTRLKVDQSRLDDAVNFTNKNLFIWHLGFTFVSSNKCLATMNMDITEQHTTSSCSLQLFMNISVEEALKQLNDDATGIIIEILTSESNKQILQW